MNTTTRSDLSRTGAIRETPFLLVVLLLAVVPLLPALAAGAWPRGHEGIRYFVLVDQFADAFAHGVLYPRWLPALFGGYGYPTFCFYQPGFFYISMPFTWLPIDRLTAMLLSLYTLFAAGGLGIYALCRVLARRELALGCAALFLLTPYLYVDLYVRSDLSELAALLIVPWSLLAVVKLDTETASQRSAAAWPAALAVSLAAVVMLHPAVGMFNFGIIGAFAVLTFVQHPHRRRFAMPVAAALAAALALSCPYWWTVFDMGPYVSLNRMSDGGYSAQRHTVAPWQFFTREWSFGGSKGNSTADTMSLQLGAIHAALALAGVVLGRGHRAVRSAFLLYLIVIVAMTPAAAWMWEHVRVARLAQFPWRLLSITASLQILCAAGIANALGRRPDRLVGVVVAAVVAAAALFHLDQFQAGFTIDVDADVSEWADQTRFLERESFAAVDEFTPTTVTETWSLVPRSPSDPSVKLTPAGSALPLDGNTAHRILYELTAAATATAVVQQLYFPGWEVRLNGELLPRDLLEDQLAADGLIRVPLPAAETYKLEAHYAGPPASWMTTIIAWAALAWVLALMFTRALASRRQVDESEDAADASTRKVV